MSENERIQDLEAAVIALKEELIEVKAELASLSELAAVNPDFDEEL